MLREEEHAEVVSLPGFEVALLGVAELPGGRLVSVYSRNRVVSLVTARLGDRGAAERWFDESLGGAWLGHDGPIFVE